ncbi:uncharacterized protein LOC143021913 [Oratosquilla oratoria]|uniref:uncharacterized protein LOC143021913 n=1 Tax=Oratosquilla oratoria TaxID=337810 RepID=UPI003F75955C
MENLSSWISDIWREAQDEPLEQVANSHQLRVSEKSSFNDNSQQPSTSTPPCGNTEGCYDTAFLDLNGIEIFPISPEGLKKVTELPGITCSLDVVYISTACAHIIKPNFLKAHCHINTTLLVESVTAFPDLKDDQVNCYENNITKAAELSGWIKGETPPPPPCHLFFVSAEH